jgi:membrane associated rhomboid family serine protease
LIPLKDNIPTARVPFLTLLLIAINVAVFVWQLGYSGEPGSATSPALAQVGASERDQLSFEYGAIPKEITEPGTYCVPAIRAEEPDCGPRSEIERETGVEQAPWWATIFTSMFMHGGLLHIAFNMLFLWIFGNNIEEAMGRLRFILFYLLAGVVAAYSQCLLNADSAVPLIGASGAVAGVMGAYMMLYPRARVLTLLIIIFFVTLVEIPALVWIGIWFVLQFLSVAGQLATPELADQGGVAYLAHIGGFLFGAITIRLFANRYRARSGLGGPIW